MICWFNVAMEIARPTCTSSHMELQVGKMARNVKSECVPWVVWRGDEEGVALVGKAEHERLVCRGRAGGEHDVAGVERHPVPSLL